MRLLIILIFTVLATGAVLNRVKAQGFQWTQGIIGNGYQDVLPVLVDANKNVYSVGVFNNTVDFDQSSSTYQLTSVVSNNMFLLKQDEVGSFLWVKQFAGSPFNPSGAFLFGRSICSDRSGNIYIAGLFSDTFDFDPGPATFYMSSETGSFVSNSGFIVKLTAGGDFIWAKKISGTNPSSMAIHSMKMDDASIYLVGGFTGTVDVDPGPNVINFSSLNPTGSGLLEKLDTAGNYLWAKMGWFGTDFDLDSATNIYGTGIFQGVIDVDPSSTTFNLTATGGDEIAIYKLDSAATFQWAKRIGGNDDDAPQGIAVDRWGNVAVTGYYDGTVDFDPGPGVSNISAISRDMFTVRLKSNGDFSWAKSVHPGGNDDGRAVSFDSSGAVYTTGERGFGDFDPGTGMYQLTSNIYVQKLDSSGNFAWARGWDGEMPNWIYVDQDLNVYVTGSFTGFNTDFDPSPNTFFLTGSSAGSAFIEKLCPSTPLFLTQVDGIFCIGQTYELSTPAIPGATYSWSQDGTVLQTGSNNTFNATATGYYEVTVTGIGCPTTSNRVNLEFLSTIFLDISSSTLNGLTMSSPVGAAIPLTGIGSVLNSNGLPQNPVPIPYQVVWSKNGVPFDTTYDSFSITYSVGQPAGTDTITATLMALSLPCAETKEAFVIINSYQTGAGSTNNEASEIKIYPSPANNSFSLKGLVRNADLRVTDLSGRELLNWKETSGNQAYDISGLTSGYYLLGIYNEEGTLVGVKALIKQ
jgi:hypothetical protein